MGAAGSKPDGLASATHDTLEILQDKEAPQISRTTLCKTDSTTSVLPMSSPACGEQPAPFSTELPERPPKLKRRMALKTKKSKSFSKSALTTATVSSPLFPISPPSSPTDSDSTVFAPPSPSWRLDPQAVVPNHVPGYFTPPTSPSPETKNLTLAIGESSPGIFFEAHQPRPRPRPTTTHKNASLQSQPRNSEHIPLQSLSAHNLGSSSSAFPSRSISKKKPVGAHSDSFLPYAAPSSITLHQNESQSEEVAERLRSLQISRGPPVTPNNRRDYRGIPAPVAEIQSMAPNSSQMPSYPDLGRNEFYPPRYPYRLPKNLPPLPRSEQSSRRPLRFPDPERYLNEARNASFRAGVPPKPQDNGSRNNHTMASSFSGSQQTRRPTRAAHATYSASQSKPNTQSRHTASRLIIPIQIEGDVSYPNIEIRASLAEFPKGRAAGDQPRRDTHAWNERENQNPPATDQWKWETTGISGNIEHDPESQSLSRPGVQRRPTATGTRNDPIVVEPGYTSSEASSDENRDVMTWEQTFSNLKTDEELARKLQAEADGESLGIGESRQQQEQGDALVAQLLLEEDRREHASAVKTRDCAVCTEAISIPDLPSLANCAHEPGTCSVCYARWIATELTEKGWKNIRCPGNTCRVMLSYDEVRAYATAETFEQYDTFATREALNGDPDFRWCRNAGCSSGQVHVSGVEGNIFTCGACGYRTCVVHENTWHDGETCEEYEYRRSGQKERDQRAQEEASIRAIEESTKKCPGQNCAYNIEKKHGCDHMTCRSCNHEFCWECLADYNRIRNEGNAAHRTSCKYHSSRIV